MRGYGKIILFGEHVCVYGYPALAVGLSKGVIAQVAKSEEKSHVLVIPSQNLKVSLQGNCALAQVFQKIIRFFPTNLLANKPPCQITLDPEIPIGAGLGSSAALSVAIIRALVQWYKLDWTSPKINEVAFAAESFFHGTPSGIDNTMATFGGFCYLRDAKRFPALTQCENNYPLGKLMGSSLQVQLPEPLRLVVMNTKKERETKRLVANVRTLVEKSPEHYHSIMQEAGGLAKEGLTCLERGEKEKLGALLNRNQELLRELKVSSPQIEVLCKKALSAGALGVKLTGAGGGGCVIAYAPGREQEIQKTVENEGFESFVTTVGVKTRSEEP